MATTFATPTSSTTNDDDVNGQVDDSLIITYDAATTRLAVLHYVESQYVFNASTEEPVPITQSAESNEVATTSKKNKKKKKNFPTSSTTKSNISSNVTPATTPGAVAIINEETAVRVVSVITKNGESDTTTIDKKRKKTKKKLRTKKKKERPEQRDKNGTTESTVSMSKKKNKTARGGDDVNKKSRTMSVADQGKERTDVTATTISEKTALAVRRGTGKFTVEHDPMAIQPPEFRRATNHTMARQGADAIHGPSRSENDLEDDDDDGVDIENDSIRNDEDHSSRPIALPAELVPDPPEQHRGSSSCNDNTQSRRMDPTILVMATKADELKLIDDRGGLFGLSRKTSCCLIVMVTLLLVCGTGIELAFALGSSNNRGSGNDGEVTNLSPTDLPTSSNSPTNLPTMPTSTIAPMTSSIDTSGSMDTTSTTNAPTVSPKEPVGYKQDEGLRFEEKQNQDGSSTILCAIILKAFSYNLEAVVDGSTIRSIL